MSRYLNSTGFLDKLLGNNRSCSRFMKLHQAPCFGIARSLPKPYLIQKKSTTASSHVVQATSPNSGQEKTWWPGDTSVPRVKVTKFEGIQGDDFRHPLDQQNTSMLRSVPGLEMVAKTFMGPVAEQVLLLENISTSIKIGNDQLPNTYKLLLDAAHVLEMDAPELYVRQNPIPNAYTLAIAGRKPFIVVHTALLELLTPAELQAVLAHELGHLKCDHGLWLTVANILASGTVGVLPVVSSMVEEALMRWLRAAELTCDRAALLVAQDSKVVISALMKLAGGSPSFANELNVDAFLQQARSYDEATASLLGWYLRNAQTRALSHPLPVLRAREIDRWAQSAEYTSLLSRNRSHRVAVQSSTALAPAGYHSARSYQQNTAAAAANTAHVGVHNVTNMQHPAFNASRSSPPNKGTGMRKL